MRKEVRNTSDDDALSLNPDEWADHFVAKYEKEPLVIRDPAVSSVSTQIPPLDADS
jgi:hypothetical protein